MEFTLVKLKHHRYWVDQHQHNNYKIVQQELIDKKCKPTQRLNNTYRVKVLQKLGLDDHIARNIDDILILHDLANRPHIQELKNRIQHCLNACKPYEDYIQYCYGTHLVGRICKHCKYCESKSSHDIGVDIEFYPICDYTRPLIIETYRFRVQYQPPKVKCYVETKCPKCQGKNIMTKQTVFLAR
jgi:hypothetical protein